VTTSPGTAGPDASVPGGVAVDAAEVAIRADVEAHGGELYHVVRRALGDDQLAEEVVQDVFVRAWRADDRWDPERGSRRTWLFAIARNAIVDAVRRRDGRPRVVGEPDEVDLVTPDRAQQIADRLAIQAAVRKLGAPHRTALIEVHLRGRPYDEVAADLDIPVGTVRSRVFHGLRKLRDELVEQGWSHA